MTSHLLNPLPEAAALATRADSSPGSAHGTVQVVDLMENALVHVYHLTRAEGAHLLPEMNRFVGSAQTMESDTLPLIIRDLEKEGFKILAMIKDGDIKVTEVRACASNIESDF